MHNVTAEIKPVGQLDREDQHRFVSFAWRGRQINNFDPAVISYPRSTMISASNEKGTLLFVPLQPVLMWSSLVVSPDATPAELAVAMQKIAELVDSTQKAGGFGEAYFLCEDNGVADDILFHGDAWEEVKNVRVLRHKVSGEWIQATIAAASEKNLE